MEYLFFLVLGFLAGCNINKIKAKFNRQPTDDELRQALREEISRG